MTLPPDPVWLVTGCSSGLGRALARAVIERGWPIALTARDPRTLDDLVAGSPQARAYTLDVTEPDAVARVVREVEAGFGRIDVLVNNAGYGYRAAVEEGEDGDVRRLFDTNLFGPNTMIRAVLPGMRARRSGAVVNVSSIAGAMAFPGSGYYSATKFALEGLTEALAKEVGPLGIAALIVAPGPFRTDFAGRSLRESSTEIGDYAGTAGLRRPGREPATVKAGDPALAAQAIIGALEATEPPLRLTLGRSGLDQVRSALRGRLAELDAWDEVGASADGPLRLNEGWAPPPQRLP